MDVEEAVERALEGPISSLGYELVAVELTTSTGRRALRISIDREGGVGTQDCALVSDAVGVHLDALDPISGAYDLEVSSPGIERPLRRPEHFQRFVGERISLRTREPIEGRRSWQGRIDAIEDGFVVLALQQGVQRIPFAAIDKANLKVDYAQYFNRGNRDAGNPP